MLIKGITKLSELAIDADKNWNVKGISNIKQVAINMAKGDLLQRGDSIVQRIAAGPDGYVLTAQGPGKLCVWAPAGGALKYYFPITIGLAVSVISDTPDQTIAKNAPLASDWSAEYATDLGEFILVQPASISVDKSVTAIAAADQAIANNVPLTREVGLQFLVTGASLDDGGAFTSYLAEARNATANDIILLPAAPAVNDAVYLGFAYLGADIATGGAALADFETAGYEASKAFDKACIGRHVFDECESITGWTGATLDNVNQKEGAGCLTRTSTTAAFSKASIASPLAPAAHGVTEADGYLHTWWYCADQTKISVSIVFTIASDGSGATNKYVWTIAKASLATGWNNLWLKFSDAVKTGTPNLSAINYYGVSGALTASIVTKIDSIYFTTALPTWWRSTGHATGTLRYDLGAGADNYVIEYHVVSSDTDGATMDPKDWTFEGSADGAAWDVLDTQAGVVWSYRNECKNYVPAVNGSYRYYRLNISANNGGANTEVGELRLFTAATGAGYKWERLWLNIGTSGAGNWTTTEEYWNGAWAGCTIVEDTISSFIGGPGLCVFRHTPQVDWAPCLDRAGGLYRYWIRFRVSNFVALVTQPKGTQAWIENLL